MESIATCNLDWAGVAAVGGVLAAFATFIAVVVALLTAGHQIRVAKEAVLADRETAFLIQKAEWESVCRFLCKRDSGYS